MANFNNDTSQYYFGTSSGMLPSNEQKICKDCEQPIRPKCPTCSQFIREASSEAEFCEGCGQEIISDEQTEVEQEGAGKQHQFKWTKCNNGVYRAKCLGCKRKTEECPSCHVTYDDTEDDYSTEANSSEPESTESEITETETDPDENLSHKSKHSGAKHFRMHRKRQKLS